MQDSDDLLIRALFNWKGRTMLTHHDHPDCPDYGYVIATGLTCPTCRDRHWHDFEQAAAANGFYEHG